MAKEYAKAFYQSKVWRDTRRLVLHRDMYTCRHCDSRAQEVHHIIPLTPDNIHDISVSLNMDNLLSLCHDCHTKITHDIGDVQDGYMFDTGGQVIKV